MQTEGVLARLETCFFDHLHTMGCCASIEQIKLDTFKDLRTEPCDNGNYKNCIAIDRLLISLRYHQTLEMSNQPQGSIDFLDDQYKQQILDDFVHLSREHGNQTQAICQYFIEEAGGKIDGMLENKISDISLKASSSNIYSKMIENIDNF